MKMSTSRLSPLQKITTLTLWLRAWRHARGMALVAVAVVALLSTTVAIGQASLNYDLACRSVLSGGGGISTGGFYGLHGALGLPFVSPKETDVSPTYAVSSASFGLRSGFLPGYFGDPSTGEASTLLPDQAFVQRLPWITKLVRVVRGGC